jgi:N-acetyl-gamma-glutamyl-phosphate reductase
MAAKIFIDGEVGTTGLQIRARLAGRSDLEFLSLNEAERKDPKARARLLNAADVAILCLPDDAAREAVAMIDNTNTRVIDASSAHRTADGWTYGFPEYEAGQREKIANASRVTNPGCYAITSVAILHPLIRSGIIPSDWPVTINAISGYSGGGRQMIASFEDGSAEDYTETPFFAYGLTLQHKHLPEIVRWSGLDHPALFVPSVGRYRQGMIVQVPLQLWSLPGAPTPEAVHKALSDHYATNRYVTVAPMADAAVVGKLDPEGLNGTNELRLSVFANADNGQAMVAGLLDNLGKGASGQTVQNLNIMLGVAEDTGLESDDVLPV